MASAGDWEKVKTYWQALLVIPGSLVRNKRLKDTFLALRTSAYGFVGHKAKIFKTDHGFRLIIDSADSMGVQYVVVDDMQEWECFTLKPKLPVSDGGSLQLVT